MRVINTEAQPIKRLGTTRPITLSRETYDWYSVDPINASVYESYEGAIQDLLKTVEKFRRVQLQLVEDTQIAWAAAKNHAS